MKNICNKSEQNVRNQNEESAWEMNAQEKNIWKMTRFYAKKSENQSINNNKKIKNKRNYKNKWKCLNLNEWKILGYFSWLKTKRNKNEWQHRPLATEEQKMALFNKLFQSSKRKNNLQGESTKRQQLPSNQTSNERWAKQLKSLIITI